jgi:anion-transporting  ArsA/GET3 family ATPase
VYALAVDPKAALMDYLELFYHLGRAGRILERFGAVDFATTVAPGLRDVLLIGTVSEAVRRRDASAPGPRGERPARPRRYDAVVLDAPPTGRIGRFLNVNAEVAGLARVGPVRNHADSIMALLKSPETAVHLVTVLEEMPVQETSDAAAELAALGLPLGGVFVNMVRPPALEGDELVAAAAGGLDGAAVAAGLAAAGLKVRDEWVEGLLDEAAEHARRVALEQRERRALDALQLPIYDLPMLSDGVDLSALYRLADLLCEQGAA